jgi:hypothetical protein
MAMGSTKRTPRVINIDIPTNDINASQAAPYMQQFLPLPADAARLQAQESQVPQQAAPVPQQPVGPFPQRKPPDPTAVPAFGGYASGGATYGLSSVPQVPTMSGTPLSSAGATSPYVSSGNPAANSPYVAQIGSNGMPIANSSSAPPAAMPAPAATSTAPPAAAPAASQLSPLQQAINSKPGFQAFLNQQYGPGWVNVNGSVLQDALANFGGTAAGQGMAAGGIPNASEMDPWYARSEERGMMQPEGLVHGLAGGRTDVHNISVPSGSYVVPADVVSGLAEGNTMSGASVMDRMMHSNPYGIAGGKGGRSGMGIPRAPAPFKQPSGAFKKGGQVHHGSAVPIVVAGGEAIYHPETIIKKFGSLKQGHAALDAFVKKVRAENVKNISKLPGPKK